MSPRAALMGLVVLAALAAPTAFAQVEEEAWATLDPVLDDAGVPHPDENPVEYLALTAGASLANVLTGSHSDESEPPADEPREPAPAHHEPAEEAPPAEEGSQGGSGPWGLGSLGDVSTRVVIQKAPVVNDLLAQTPLGLADGLLPLPDASATASPAPGGGPSTASPAPLASAPAAVQDAVATPGAAVVAIAGAAAVASTFGTSTFDWERVRRFGLFAVLYTRIAKDRLLDHGARERLLHAARERPGSPLGDLADAAGLPRNTATYHLNRLEREGLLTSARKGRSRLYFAVGGEARKSQADAFAALRHDNGRALARAIGQNPGVDQQALCAAVGLTPSLVHWHADRLVASGVIRKEREGRRVHYYPGPAFAIVDHVPAAPAPVGSDVPPMAC